MHRFLYYLTGIVSLVVFMVLQISAGDSIRIASAKPALIMIPLLFFTLGIYPRFLSGFIFRFSGSNPDAGRYQAGWIGLYTPRALPLESFFRGSVLGFAAGFAEGINSGVISGSIFSWCVTGAVMGLVSGPINKESGTVRALFLFAGTLLQAIIFFVFLPAGASDYQAGFLFRSAVVSALYTTVLGTLFMRLFEGRSRDRIVRFGA